MTTYLLVVLVIAILWFGSKILERLPKTDGPQHVRYETGEHAVGFRVDALTELDFDISYVDGWGTGRRFMLYGPPASDAEGHGGLDFGKRTGVHVHPTAQWFERSRIGHIRTYESGACESHVYLPYQIARHVLEDLRRGPQYVTVRFSKRTGKDGEITYPIYGFELSEPLD